MGVRMGGREVPKAPCGAGCRGFEGATGFADI
jgi:hypothetical protein